MPHPKTNFDFFKSSPRTPKPRSKGLTGILDDGWSLGFFKDILESHHHIVDYIKLGWGTACVSANLHQKLEIANKLQVPLCLGGTLFEKAYAQNCVEDYVRECKDLGFKYIEFSNGVSHLSSAKKIEFIQQYKSSCTIFSEVGFKFADAQPALSPSDWCDLIEADLEAGAAYVILEARESGRCGIADPTGNVRMDIVESIFERKIPIERLIFEAPTKQMQIALIKSFGQEVNLANILASDIISTETIRRGLRADTFFDFTEV